MSDFDFDELDKAVAGALSADEPATQGSSVPAETPRAEVSAMPAEPARPTLPPAARRGAGRFMDVVHPSSDMRTRSSFTPPTPPSEQAEAPATSAPASPAPTVSDSFDDSYELTDLKPLESPFLPDAKVEKKPLGNAHPTGPQVQKQPVELDDDKDIELLLEAPDELRLEATTMPDPIDFVAQINALSSEAEDTGIIEAPVTPEVSKVSEESTSFESEPSYNDSESAGPASITQQYEEKPSVQQESGAIYDTENYHQPIADAGKKSHGAWTILWIILLVILGAGAGVAFYLFVLPML